MSADVVGMPGQFVVIMGGPKLFIIARAAGHAFLPGAPTRTATDFTQASRIAEEMAAEFGLEVYLDCHIPPGRGDGDPGAAA